MNSKEFQQSIRKRPVLIHRNDGREFFIEKAQNAMVGDDMAGFLVFDDKGVKRNANITLSKVSSVTPRMTRPLD